MHSFALSRAEDPAIAIAAHAQDPRLAFIAGGTDLLGLMKDRAALPERLLDINGLPDMARIEGLADGGLGMTGVVRGPAGERWIPFADFHRLPGDTPERDNALGRGDLIVSIEVPACAEGRASHYLKIRDRQSYEFALVSAAAAVATDGRRIRTARLALGGVAHKPWRLRAAQTALRGALLADIDALRSAIATSFTDARPLADNAFKVELAQRVALRALQTAGARA